MKSEIIYQMSRVQYNGIKWPLFWDNKSKKLLPSPKPLTEEQILDYVNSTYGLIGTVKEIQLVA